MTKDIVGWCWSAAGVENGRNTLKPSTAEEMSSLSAQVTHFRRISAGQPGKGLQLGYGSIPILSILMGWTSIYQLFWCSPGVQGFDTLPLGTGNWQNACCLQIFAESLPEIRRGILPKCRSVRCFPTYQFDTSDVPSLDTWEDLWITWFFSRSVLMPGPPNVVMVVLMVIPPI